MFLTVCLVYCIVGFFLGMGLVTLTKVAGRFDPEWEGITTFIFVLFNTLLWPAIIVYIVYFCIAEEIKG